MPGRVFSSGSYEFGFNGKENDREWGGQLIQDYGFRLYNPAIGKFLSVDPLSPSYPWYTPYQFAGNKPIWAVDLDGLEEQYATTPQVGTSPALDNLAPAYNNRIPFDQQNIAQQNQLAEGSENTQFTVIADRNTGVTLGAVVEFGANFTPAGVIVDVKDFVQAGISGDVIMMAVAAAAIIPIFEYAKQAYKARKASKADDGIIWTGDLSKTKSQTRGGHREAANKQLNEAMGNDPKLKTKIEGYDPNALDNTNKTIKPGNKTPTRKNPEGLEWDHNTNDPTKIDLRTKENHAEKTAKDPGRAGGFAKFFKKK